MIGALLFPLKAALCLKGNVGPCRTNMRLNFVNRGESRRASASASIAAQNFCLAGLTPSGAPEAANRTRGLGNRTQRKSLLINRSCGRMFNDLLLRLVKHAP